jgi:hypothetical protein
MKPAAKGYKGTLGGQEAFLVRSLAEERRGIFTIRDAARLVGTQTRENGTVSGTFSAHSLDSRV